MTRLHSRDLRYQVVRSRRKTADIVIERNGTVIVRAPEWVDDDQVKGIIESRHFWIWKGLAQWRDLNATKVLREYRNGEGFLYLGRAYRLLLVSGQKEPLLLRNGRFTLRRELAEEGEISAAKAAFQDFYVVRGQERLEERAAYYGPKVGVTPSGIIVKELGHRWASCSTRRRLAFHWKCMMAPQSIIDYILVHELCHIHHRHHTAAFWNEVDKVMPDYRDRKEWLRKNGAGLDV